MYNEKKVSRSPGTLAYKCSPHPPLRGPPSPLGKARERTDKLQFPSPFVQKAHTIFHPAQENIQSHKIRKICISYLTNPLSLGIIMSVSGG